MISDLIEVASHIKTIYQRLEYLDKKFLAILLVIIIFSPLFIII